MPKVSKAVICLAVYNGEAYLAELLDSLVAQSVAVDIVVRDDGSSDASMDIVREYASRFSFLLVANNNTKTGSACTSFSKLLAEVVAYDRYQYYFFADQDDVWRSDKVDILLRKMCKLEKEDSDRAILLHSDLAVVDGSLNLIAESFFAHQGLSPHCSGLNRVLVENPATGCALAFNHNLAVVVSPVSAAAIMHDWWCSMVAYAIGAHVEVVDDCLVKYRQHQGNTLGAKKSGLRHHIHTALRWHTLDLDRYYDQVRALLTSEEITLSSDVRDFLEAFVQTRSLGAIARLRFFLKFRIVKSSKFKTLGLCLLLVTC